MIRGVVIHVLGGFVAELVGEFNARADAFAQQPFLSDRDVQTVNMLRNIANAIDSAWKRYEK